jgi:hypothetical protein
MLGTKQKFLPTVEDLTLVESIPASLPCPKAGEQNLRQVQGREALFYKGKNKQNGNIHTDGTGQALVKIVGFVL